MLKEKLLKYICQPLKTISYTTTQTCSTHFGDTELEKPAVTEANTEKTEVTIGCVCTDDIS